MENENFYFSFTAQNAIMNIDWVNNKDYELMEKYLLKNNMHIDPSHGAIIGKFWEIHDEFIIMPKLKSIGTINQLISELKLIIDYLENNKIPWEGYSIIFNKGEIPCFMFIENKEIIIGSIDNYEDVLNLMKKRWMKL